MVGLGANDQIDGGCASLDFGAFGLRDAAGDGDGQALAALLPQLPHAADLGIDLLCRLFTDVAGVQDHQIGVFGAVGGSIASLGQALGHPLRIIDVHLAPVGADKDALFRILCHSGLVSLRHWAMKTKNGRKVITLRPPLKKGRRDYFFPRRVPRPISLASLERWAA